MPGEAAFSLASDKETFALGAALAGHLARGDVVALSGELGPARQRWRAASSRGFARLSHQPDEPVPSPSFPIAQHYEFGSFILWHFDFFRLKSPSELVEIGWDDALGATLVEWPELAPGFLPEPHLAIRLDWSGEGRVAKITGALRLVSLANLVRSIRQSPELS